MELYALACWLLAVCGLPSPYPGDEAAAVLRAEAVRLELVEPRYAAGWYTRQDWAADCQALRARRRDLEGCPPLAAAALLPPEGQCRAAYDFLTEAAAAARARACLSRTPEADRRLAAECDRLRWEWGSLLGCHTGDDAYWRRQHLRDAFLKAYERGGWPAPAPPHLFPTTD